MKSALRIAILATVLTFAAAAPTDATVLLDDTFADGTRTNQNLPTDSAWFFSTAADVMTTTGSIYGDHLLWDQFLRSGAVGDRRHADSHDHIHFK